MKRFITRVLIPVALVVCILFSLPLVCGHGHGHGHGHSHGHVHSHGHSHGQEHEPAAYKWSKQANEPYHEDLMEEEEQQEDILLSSSSSPLPPPPPTKQGVWMEALLATLGISVAPYVILFFIPVTNAKEHEPYLKVLLAFASGGLLGDAFLHLIPHALIAKAAMDSHSHSHAHSHAHAEGAEEHSHDMTIGLAVLGGIIAFLVVEKIVRIFKGGHGHGHGHTQGGAHSGNAANGEATKSEADKGKKGDKEGEKKKGEKKKNNANKQVNKKDEGQIKVAGYLNLAADFTHNLTDGLAIGASFLAGKSVGTVTTLTIFLHEIPHEIGDFAILLQSGCSRRKAMMLQLVTAIGAFTGTCISLLAEGADESAVAWVLPFTAGGFIYIATVSVIPELLENTHFWQSVVEVVALLAGVVLMMGIAYLEEAAGHEH